MPDVRKRLFLPGALTTLLLLPDVAAAQQSCHVLCAPSFAVWPELHRSHAFDQPRVRNLQTGAVSELPARNNLLLFFLVSIPTQLPRLSVIFDVSWLPTAEARSNPFTEYGAAELGGDVRANLPAVSAGVSYQLLKPAQTGGWLALGPYVTDLLSKAAQPDARSDYTHKLELGATALLAPFSQLPSHAYLRGVRIAGTVDWVATGLPQAGDELPQGERVFLDDVSGVSLSLGLTLPVAPLR